MTMLVTNVTQDSTIERGRCQELEASERTRAETVVTERDETDLNRRGSARARGSCGLLWQSTVLTSFIKKGGCIYLRQRTQGDRAGPQYVRVELQGHGV